MKFLKTLLALFLFLNLMLLGFFLYPMSDLLRAVQPADTVKIYDRNKTLLYQVLNEKTGRQSRIAFDQIPQPLKDAFISAEDRRFYEHGGIDLRAILRAVWQNISAGEIVSGGSTITQQAVRNAAGRNQKRTLFQKIKESLWAIKISKRLSKDEIFEYYLNSVYFGGLAYGVESASWQYFNKSARNLDLAESAFLAGLPQAPNRFYPFRYFEKARARQAEVLKAMRENQKISPEEYALALEEEIALQPSGQNSKKAPHFVDYILSRLAEKTTSSSEVVTTLDFGLQQKTESILASSVSFLAHLNIENAAAVILDVRNGDILAMVGSVDYESESIDGKVNVATSLRQPGSSIKPLIYALALEKGWNPETIILDEPARFETEEGLPYTPQNYDLAYRGEVTLAESLAQSLNIPAVKTLNFVGLSFFLQKAPEFGITSLTETPAHYGLSLALGSGEVRLLELVNAYSVFANQGKRPHLRALLSDEIQTDPVISVKTSRGISAILSSNELRMPAFGEENPLKFSFSVAAKTGTTRNFRDNWTIGYTDDYAVGVWVGNSSGETMQGVSGISGAAPLFHRLMNILREDTGTALTVVSAEDFSPESATSTSRFQGGYFQRNETSPFRILSPFANDVFLFDPGRPAAFQKIKLEASESAEWSVNGQPVGQGVSVLWPIQAGKHEISAVSAGQKKTVMIEVKK